jgi:hypothetical protein
MLFTVRQKSHPSGWLFYLADGEDLRACLSHYAKWSLPYFFRLIEKSTKKDQGEPMPPAVRLASASPCVALIIKINF